MSSHQDNHRGKASPTSVPVTISHISTGAYAASAMHAGIQLGVFSALESSPATSEILADRLAVSFTKLKILLYTLAAIGLLVVDDHGRFSNSAEASEYLVQGKSGYFGSITAMRLGALSGTEATIRKGVPQTTVDFSKVPAHLLQRFYTGMHEALLKEGVILAERLDFSGYKRLLDVGGGSGGVAIAACSHCPRLRATVFELPTVVPITRQFVSASDVCDRITVEAGDMIDASPRDDTYDLALMHHFIQILPSTAAQQALDHLGPMMMPGGRLVIVGRIVDDSRLTPLESALFNMVFINTYDHGQAYTEGEYRSWLTAAGFEDIHIENPGLPTGDAIVMARWP